jgi:lambda family phage portal protein
VNVFKDMGSMERSEEYKELTRPKLQVVKEEIPQKPKVKAYSPYSPYGSQYQYGGVGSDGSKWRRGLSNTGQSPVINHWLTRHNARSAYHETAQARSIVDRFADTVVDVGMTVCAEPLHEILGITPEKAREIGKTISQRFHLWASSKKALRDETMTFYQAQRLGEIYQQRDNDYFVRLFYSNRRDLLNPLQIQFIDPDMVIGSGFTSTYGFQDTQYNGRIPVDGIYRDKAGREIAYQVIGRKDDGQIDRLVIPARGPKSGRKFMIHGFYPEYANQGRGYSRLAHALQDFEGITDFTQAQIQKAITQSSMALYVKPSKDNAASNPYEGMLEKGAGPLTAAEEAAVETGDGDAIFSYERIPEATIDQPGTVGIFNLQEGEDLRAFENTAPAESFDRFVDAFTSYLAASMSIPIEVLLMKFNQNYSASRGALVLFWRVAEIWRAELISDFLNPVYKAWLGEEIAAGRIALPGWSDPLMRAAWANNVWWGAPMPNIDPAKEAKASKDYIEIGATDLNRVARNLNGSNGDANRARNKEQIAELTPVPWSKGSQEEAPQEAEEGGAAKRKPGRPIGS